jgi:DNA-binding CsgD family transcriptional regulator
MTRGGTVDDVRDEVGFEGPAIAGAPPRRTVAWVDVRYLRSVAPAMAVVALDRVRRSVRGDDRICPMTVSRLAVAFGPSVAGVPPRVLGDRLVRAVDPSGGGPGASLPVAVSIGVDRTDARPGPAELTRSAGAAARMGAASLARGTAPGPHRRLAVVTLDSLMTRRPTPGSPSTGREIRRRSIRCVELGQPWPGPAIPSAPERRGAVGEGGSPALDLSVLVIDPIGTALGGPGLAARSAAATAEQLGCRAVRLAVAPEALPPPTGADPVDVVVVALDGGWEHPPSSWTEGTWGVPARVTAAFDSAGIPVLALHAGSGAGALASCVAQGATAVFSPDQLPDALQSIGAPSGDDGQPVDQAHPEKFRALVGLTASERRVLYYLTQGWAAQDMTDELVVSLTTVRSHIRSVLRKLGVRSQLAAVALANSRDLRRTGHRAPA